MTKRLTNKELIIISDYAQQLALGGKLSSWGILKFDDVLEALESEDYEEDSDILFWEPFEHYTNEDMRRELLDDYHIFKKNLTEMVEELKK